MSRNLKVLGVAVFAVLAFSAFGASAASAALFHKVAAGEVNRLTVTPDGSGTTAHQVFDAAGAAITCTNVSGEATLAAAENTPETITATNIKYPATGGTCNFVGQTATVEMTSCGYKFTAAATGTPGTNAAVAVVCTTAGDEIHFKVPNPACNVTIPAQSLSGITYHNNAAKSEVTVEAHVTGITYTAVGAGCPIVGHNTNGNYTTGNFIVTGENTSSVMKNVFVE